MATTPAPQFGPNDWYVQEKYEQFLADPDGVDGIWQEFFRDNARGSA